MTEHDRRLIEDSLPLEAISYQSAREKSIRHGHISTLHIWWARRPLAAMRAAIFAALMPAPKDDAEREEMHQLIGGVYNGKTGKWEGGICDWDAVKDGNNEAIRRAQELIAQHYPDRPKVLDPFMGGGSTGLEALRLGADTYGVELNPVAHIIELCTLVYPQKYGQRVSSQQYQTHKENLAIVEDVDATKKTRLKSTNQESLEMDLDHLVNPLEEDVKSWAAWVANQSESEIGYLYETQGPIGSNVVAYLWARTATCPNPSCRAEMPTIRQYWLSKRPNKRIALKPIVNRKNKQVLFDIVRNDEIDFDPSDGTMQRAGVKCLICDQSVGPDYLRNYSETHEWGECLLGVVYTQDGSPTKYYRTATEQDLALYEQLNIPEKLDYPRDVLPLMSGTFNAPIYGLDEWGKLFNKRQLVSLMSLIRHIHAAYDEMLQAGYERAYANAVCTYLALILDGVADRNSVLCTWRGGSEDIGHTFGRQALPMVWDFTEINPFSGSTGSWMSATEKVLRAIAHSSLVSNEPATIAQGSATRLSYLDESMHAVITDPPYYNAVPYADLSDFFYVWMRRTLGEIYPNTFITPLAPKSAEITEMSGWDAIRYEHKDKTFYENQMTLAFAEAQRVTMRNGVSVIVFAHKSTSAWETLINSLLQSGLVVSASWPLHTESSGRLRALNSAALASSIFIVCRKRIAETSGIYDEVRPQIKDRIRERLNFFWKQGIRGADFFISAIGPAVEVFGQYRTVRKLSGDEVTVAELLDIVQQEVADYALSQVMNGGATFGPFDAATRLYIMYRWSYGRNKIEFDDGMRLAMALGAEVDSLLQSGGVLKRTGSNVELLDPFQRAKTERLGEPGRDGRRPPLIDMVHRAALLWRSGKRDELALYVSQNVGSRVEGLRAVAQALVNVLPDGDKEKQLYEGFLQGELPDAPVTLQLFPDEDF